MKTPTKMMWVALLFGVVGCNLASQVSAKTVAISTLLSTPPVKLEAEALAGQGLDGGGVVFDGGVSLPRADLVHVYFGRRQSDSLDVPPVGVAGATVTLREANGASWPLADQGSGNYGLLPDAGFAYHDLATYDFTMTLSGTAYVAEVAQVPGREDISAFHPAAGYVVLDAGQPFEFTRPDPPAGQERPLGFINVFPISLDGARGQPTYTNVPSTPLEFLKLVVTQSDWTKTAVRIPDTAFPGRDRNYLVILQAAKLGGPKSDNLFTGSVVLAGTADVAVVKTRP